MHTFAAETHAPPGAAWRLLARPGEWSRWSPHVRGAWGLGAPEVRAGATGAARLFGALPIPVRVTAKHEGRSWTWRVGPGPVEMVHRVDPAAGGGATVTIELHAPAGLEAALATAYGPLIRFSLRRLARAAEERTA
jgi:hypothetical protein